MAESLAVKPSHAIAWIDVDAREAALVQRCVAHDEDACTELVSEHQRMVYQLSLNLLGDHNEALDLSQEVFLRVFRTIHGFRGHSALRTWIYRIVVNQARNRQRWWRRRHRGQQVSLDDHLREYGELPERNDTDSPDRLLGRKEMAARIRAALDTLPFEQRTALVLREIDGLSYEEIGYSLGVAVGTVKSRLARAREALRGQLRDI
jgi:RNA polymerase sigma-70 factor, ECF subfamily